ncbi:hypothetical protein Q7P37_000832 [Cladosporium fusiforme]
MKYNTLISGGLHLLHTTPISKTPSRSPQLASSSARCLPMPRMDTSLRPTHALPTLPSIRNATDLSNEEKEWLEVRRNATVQPMRELLGRLNIEGLDTNKYIDDHQNNASALPNIAIAVSGGGYRAMLNGAGHVQAWDSRTENSTNDGGLGGLLQSSTYIAGLSGGSWLVGSLYTNNFSSVSDIMSYSGDGSSLWQFENSIFEGPSTGSIQLFDSVGYYTSIKDSVDDKNDAGYDTTLTDYWGRALSYQLINATDGGPSTNFTAGSPRDDEKCVTGFDSASFIMGTSSSLFNQGLLMINNTETSGAFQDALQSVFQSTLEAIGRANNDIADYPNPFYGYNNDTNPNAESEQLTLVDGGEDLQNIPLNPVIQPERHIDVIFAIDSSADTNTTWPTSDSATGWPNGASLEATYRRSFASIQNDTSFPSIPSVTTFANLGLNAGPTFFGCNSSNFTDASNIPPLIVYLPNAPYVYNSNVSTFDPDYNTTERDAIVLNGYNSATQGNGTLGQNWPTCVGCAILSRSLDRTGTEVPDVCRTCFEHYCWDGTIDDGELSSYVPEMKLADMQVDVNSGAERLGMVQDEQSMPHPARRLGFGFLGG